VRVGSGATSSESISNLGRFSVDVGSVNRVRDNDNDNDDNDNGEELGADETDKLVGQLIDYVSDLTLLP
jgi:hypothetical protein